MKLQLAQKAVLFNDGKILMIQKGAEDPCNPLKWEITGGRLEVGEDLLDHLKREVKEEVGLETEIGPPLMAWKWILLSEIASLDLIPTSRDASLESLKVLQSYLRQWRRSGIRQDSGDQGVRGC
jgi:hypothetical protein